jgi:hypothetical protein
VGLTTDRFVAKKGSRAAPAWGRGGADRHRPLEHALRRLGDTGWSMHGPGLSSVCQGRYQAARTALATSGTVVAAVALMAADGGQWGRRRPGCVRSDRPL